MNRIKMCRLDDLPPGRMLERRILARRMAVYNDNGTVIGFQSECRHQAASLSGGRVSDGIVECPRHGWKFDLRTGRCLTQAGMDLRRYDVEIVDDIIYLLI